MRGPSRQRNNPKARSVVPPPDGVNLVEVAESCRYVGSRYHKIGRTFTGTSGRRWPDASICPKDSNYRRDLMERWLRDAIKAGRIGAWQGGVRATSGIGRGGWYSRPGRAHRDRGSTTGNPLAREQRVRGL